jgi:hypothetical protein
MTIGFAADAARAALVKAALEARKRASLTLFKARFYTPTARPGAGLKKIRYYHYGKFYA